MGRLRGIGIGALACLALGLAACGGGDDSGGSGSAEGGTTKLTVGTLPITDLMQFYVAEDQGFFAEEGLDVESTSLAGGAAIAAGVQGGAIDVGWSNSVSIYQAHSRGLEFEFLSGGLFQGPDHWTQQILVQDGSSIASPDDLAGKSVAVNTLGNINTLVMMGVLEEAGLAPDAADLVEVPFPEMQSALDAGRVDATLPTEPFVTTATEAGAVSLDETPFRVLGDDPFVAAWFASSKWIDENPDTVAKFQRAIAKASDYIDEHPEARATIQPKYTKVAPELAKQISFGINRAELAPEDLQPTIDMAARLKLIPEGFDAGEILVDSPESGT